MTCELHTYLCYAQPMAAQQLRSECKKLTKKLMMEYKASFDTLSKVISVGVIILFVFIGMRSVKALLVAQGDTTTILIHSGILLFLFATLFISYLYSTQHYLITDNEFIIKRPIGERKILIADIAEIRLVEQSDMTGTIRTFGNGGIFGYYGKYHNKTFGSMTLYTTQQANRVFIRTKSGDKIIISPDDLSLVDNLKSELSNKQ